jgi:hypothetical protein
MNVMAFIRKPAPPVDPWNCFYLTASVGTASPFEEPWPDGGVFYVTL